jgi:hypothetical protein
MRWWVVDEMSGLAVSTMKQVSREIEMRLLEELDCLSSIGVVRKQLFSFVRKRQARMCVRKLRVIYGQSHS